MSLLTFQELLRGLFHYCRSAHNGSKTKNAEDGETVTGAGKFHVNSLAISLNSA